MAKKFFTDESLSTLITESKKYADSAANAVKNDLLNGAGEAYDTLKELGDLIDDNQDAIGALETVATNKADKEHTHSWNALEDKPFYETEPVETLVVPETTISVGTILYASIPDISLTLEEGQTYIVTFNGTRYECVAWYNKKLGYIVIGNGTIYGGEDGGEDVPFLIEDSNSDCFLDTTTSGTYTLSISHYGSIIVELDSKYIPYVAGRKVENKTMVDNDGNEYVGGVGAEIFNNYNVNIASGEYSHAEGFNTIASDYSSHAEGSNTIASGEYSHAEGSNTIASGYIAHAEGEGCEASGYESHAEGGWTKASGNVSHAEGQGSVASGNVSHAEGFNTIAAGKHQHVQGEYNIEDAADTYAHIVGNGASDESRSNAHTLDWDGNAWFQGDVYVGSTSGTNKDEGSKKLVTEDELDWDKLQNKPFYTADPVLTEIIPETTFTGTSQVIDSDLSSLTIGETYTVVWDGTTYDNLVCKNVSGLAAIGASDFTFTDYPFLIGIDNGNCNLMASTNASHTVKVTGMVSEVIPLDRKYIAEYLDSLPVYAGQKVAGKEYTVDDEQVIAGNGAEIFNNYSSNIASATYAHAEGSGTLASGTVSHAEGYQTVAKGGYSHAQGYKTQATGNRAHAEGQGSVASGNDSHAEGLYTIAAGANQHAQGKYNVEDTAGTYAHIVGNGSNVNNRKNAHTLDWSGNAEFAGDVKVNACGGENPISLVALYEEVQALKALLVDGNEVAY